MAIESHNEVQILLDKLENLVYNDNDSNGGFAKDIIVDLSELLSSDTTSAHYDVHVSCSLGKNGLLQFCRQTVSRKHYGDAKKSALEVIRILLEKQASKVAQYTDEIFLVSVLLYRGDPAAKVRCAALELLSVLLLRCVSYLSADILNVEQLVVDLSMGIRGAKVPSGCMLILPYLYLPV
ncbi:uncharacterized protein LOC125179327 [Hyalella azteca]|uniref:Uncharacterized protein LOC125179327 n=1 Tax=Hyalella azteca TaxID=294128 RepID=A0A979FUM5_HYAAZ|nr:uncharacterized protein LOC125179327 [Hyalella azteca]